MELGKLDGEPSFFLRRWIILSFFLAALGFSLLCVGFL